MFVHILPEKVRRLIAAGEVIEAPRDVVKELIENSLDAQSTHIEVEISKGGKRLIRVKDNGTGIHPDDIDKVVLQGATSKIKDENDLMNIESYGFRGEALFSISSVSRFTLRSRYFQERKGYEIYVEGGKFLEKKEAGMQIGTEVIVRDLFFNTPVRKKFLPKEDTERRKIHELVKIYSIVRPETGFSFISEGREVLKLSPSSEEERIENVFERRFEKIEGEKEFLRLRAYISRNVKQGKFYIFVNSRPVENKNLKEFLRKVLGYKTLGIIFLELPAVLVDFNVHPKKKEVKFVKERKTLSLIKEILSPKSYDIPVPFLSQEREVYRPRYELIGQLENTFILARIDDYIYFFDQHLLSERINYEKLGEESKACRIAVKGGEKLSEKEMRELLESWFSLENPHVCPHGRPIYYRIHLKEIYEKLGRSF